LDENIPFQCQDSTRLFRGIRVVNGIQCGFVEANEKVAEFIDEGFQGFGVVVGHRIIIAQVSWRGGLKIYDLEVFTTEKVLTDVLYDL
jgi:hypothetical protein